MIDRSGRDRRWWALPAAVATAVAMLVATPAAVASDFVPGQVIVRYKSGTTASERSASRARAGVSFKRALRIRGAQLVTVKGSVPEAAARLARQRDVLYAQPNFIYKATALPPNDPLFGQLWGLRNTGQFINDPAGPSTATAGVDINVLPAWDSTRGAGAEIAIVDTGVDRTHPDLAGANIDSSHGADFVDGDLDPDDENNVPVDIYHGTHVAGTAAANDNNSKGIAGVAPDAKIMAVRVLDSGGFGTSETIAQGIAYAANAGADAINLSLGGSPTGSDSVMSNAIDLANARNSVVVAAAGNGGNDGIGDDNDVTPDIPCNFPQPNLICVAAVDDNGNLTSFSNYGHISVDVGAPGQSILSAFGHQTPDPNQYQWLDGTSMAAPHVSGVAALLARADPVASDTQIVQAMKQSVRPLPSLQGGFTVTGGMVNAAAAIRRVRVLTTPPARPKPPAPTAPAKAIFKKSKRTIRVSRRGRFSFNFTAGPGLKGRISFKTVRKVRPRKHGRKRRATFANKTFLVPASGKVKVKIKLSRRNRLILKRYKKLRIAVTVKLRNSAGLTSTAKVRITLKAPKRRRH